MAQPGVASGTAQDHIVPAEGMEEARIGGVLRPVVDHEVEAAASLMIGSLRLGSGRDADNIMFTCLRIRNRFGDLSKTLVPHGRASREDSWSIEAADLRQSADVLRWRRRRSQANCDLIASRLRDAVLFFENLRKGVLECRGGGALERKVDNLSAEARWKREIGLKFGNGDKMRARLPPSAAFCRLLPPFAAFCRLLPPFAAFCRLLPPFAAFL